MGSRAIVFCDELLLQCGANGFRARARGDNARQDAWRKPHPQPIFVRGCCAGCGSCCCGPRCAARRQSVAAQPLAAARRLGGGRGAGAVGRGLAGGATAAQVAGREDRQRTAGPARPDRGRGLQALDAGADAARRVGGRCQRRAAAAHGAARLCGWRAAVAAAPGAGDRRDPGRCAARAPDPPGRRPLRHRRHPGQAGGAAQVGRQRRAGALCALQHRAQGRADRLR